MIGRADHKRRGFSLVEVLAALLIFSVAIVTLVENMGQTGAAQNRLLARQEALMLAENLLEQVRAEDELAEGSTSGFSEIEGLNHTVTIEPTELADLMEVTARVVWSQGARERAVELVTLMTTRRRPEP